MRPVKEWQAVAMLLSVRAFVPALAAILAAGPAQAAKPTTIFEDAQTAAIDAGTGLAAWARQVAHGDMAAIEAGSFVLSGFVALTGLWLLVVRRSNLLRLGFSPAAPEMSEAEGPRAEGERPIRLLEAIAAAKAQMAISESEKKHAR